MDPGNAVTYELSNYQRKYFGLQPVEDTWEKVQLNGTIVAYFDGDRIGKILNYGWGYLEYDTSIETINRQVLVPKTSRGRQQNLTVPRLLKIKGSGIQFSGSFLGGNIHVYDNRRTLFFIKSFPEDGDMGDYKDIDNWISNYIAKAPPNYFDWLRDQLAQPRLKAKIQAGDLIAFKLSPTEFGFARVLANLFAERKSGLFERHKLYWAHPRSLIVAPYAWYTYSIEVNIDVLIAKPTLPTICIFDIDVYRGEMPIIGHRRLTDVEKQIPFPTKAETSATINITKKDIDAFIQS